MSKVSIVYIGPKPRKKDTITGSRCVFPRHKPVEVDEDIAYQLLDYTTVWIESSELEAHLKRVNEQQSVSELEKQQAEEEAERKRQAASMVIEFSGETIDLEKFNSAKLKTFVAAHEIDCEAKGAQEDVATYRTRVRDAARKHEAEKAEA